MKGKKELPYQELVTATVDAVKNHFKPDVGIIKERIDSLQEQEYMKRKEDDMSVMVYMA